MSSTLKKTMQKYKFKNDNERKSKSLHMTNNPHTHTSRMATISRLKAWPSWLHANATSGSHPQVAVLKITWCIITFYNFFPLFVLQQNGAHAKTSHVPQTNVMLSKRSLVSVAMFPPTFFKIKYRKEKVDRNDKIQNNFLNVSVQTFGPEQRPVCPVWKGAPGCDGSEGWRRGFESHFWHICFHLSGLRKCVTEQRQL